jgi:hypothetical protein
MLTDDTVQLTAEDMICRLAGMCNHASTIDGSGFSRMDADFGHSLAEHASSGKAWSPKQAAAALKLLRKYQKQLGGREFMDNWLGSPKFRIEPDSQAKTPNSPSRTLTSVDSNALFVFKYDTDLVQAIKSEIRGEHKGKKFWPVWHPDKKCWMVTVNETSIWPIMDIADRFGFEIDRRFTDYFEKVQEKVSESRTMLSLNDGRHIVVVSDKIIISVANAAILEEFEHAIGN